LDTFVWYKDYIKIWENKDMSLQDKNKTLKYLKSQRPSISFPDID
jgi:hypothetical protein